MNKQAMKKNATDLLNVGIGLVRSSEEKLQVALKNIVSYWETIAEKGSSDSSSEVKKIREVLDNAIAGIQKLSNQAEGNLKYISAEAEKGYKQFLAQIKSLVGEQQYNQWSKKLEGAYQLALSKAKEAQARGAEIFKSAVQNNGSAKSATRSKAQGKPSASSKTS